MSDASEKKKPKGTKKKAQQKIMLDLKIIKIVCLITKSCENHN